MGARTKLGARTAAISIAILFMTACSEGGAPDTAQNSVSVSAFPSGAETVGPHGGGADPGSSAGAEMDSVRLCEVAADGVADLFKPVEPPEPDPAVPSLAVGCSWTKESTYVGLTRSSLPPGAGSATDYLQRMVTVPGSPRYEHVANLGEAAEVHTAGQSSTLWWARGDFIYGLVVSAPVTAEQVVAVGRKINEGL